MVQKQSIAMTTNMIFALRFIKRIIMRMHRKHLNNMARSFHVAKIPILVKLATVIFYVGAYAQRVG